MKVIFQSNLCVLLFHIQKKMFTYPNKIDYLTVQSYLLFPILCPRTQVCMENVMQNQNKIVINCVLVKRYALKIAT